MQRVHQPAGRELLDRATHGVAGVVMMLHEIVLRGQLGSWPQFTRVDLVAQLFGYLLVQTAQPWAL